jgi:hypothetical protein
MEIYGNIIYGDLLNGDLYNYDITMLISPQLGCRTMVKYLLKLHPEAL